MKKLEDLYTDFCSKDPAVIHPIHGTNLLLYALHYANVYHLSPKELDSLITHPNTNLNLQDSKGNTALMRVLYLAEKESFRLNLSTFDYLVRNTNAKFLTQSGETALMVALSMRPGAPVVLSYFVVNGTRDIASGSGVPVRKKHIAHWIKHCDLAQKDNYKDTALLYALSNKQEIDTDGLNRTDMLSLADYKKLYDAIDDHPTFTQRLKEEGLVETWEALSTEISILEEKKNLTKLLKKSNDKSKALRPASTHFKI